MMLNSKFTNQLIEIFNDAQSTAGYHQKCVEMFKKFYRENTLEQFLVCFRIYVSKLLNCDFKIVNLYCERSLDFVALFISTIEKEEVTEDYPISLLLHNFMAYLFEIATCSNPWGRYRSCQLIGKILMLLIDTEVSSELCKEIEDVLLVRAKDIVMGVRLQALFALRPLQSFSPDCPVTALFIELMFRDPHAKVRQECIKLICVRNEIVPHLLNASRDESTQVKLAVYQRASLSGPKCFKIFQKHILLKNGFNDNTPQIKNYVKGTLCLEWLRIYDYNYIKLIDSLRLDSDWNILNDTSFIVQNVLLAIFEKKTKDEICKVLNFNDQFLIPIEDLNWSSIMYWRALLNFLRLKHNGDNLPELVPFAKYVLQYFKMKNGVCRNDEEEFEYQFILQQLFLMGNEFDFSDTTCQNIMNQVIRFILIECSLCTEVIDVIVEILHQTIPDINNEISFVLEIMSEIMYDTKEDENLNKTNICFKIEKLRMQRNILREEMDGHIKERNFIKAEECSQELIKVNNMIDEQGYLNNVLIDGEVGIETNDTLRIMKYLDIANALLSSTKIRTLSPYLVSLKDNFIQQHMLHANFEICYRSMKGLSLYSIIDEKYAKVILPTLISPVLDYKTAESAGSTKMMVLVMFSTQNIILIHGIKMFAQTDPEENLTDSAGEDNQKIFQGGLSISDYANQLVKMMNDDDSEIQEAAGHILCSLILFGRFQSSQVIAHLVVKWCNPAANDELNSRLKAKIAVALNTFPQVPSLGNQVAESIPYIVSIIQEATENSPLVRIDIDLTCKFLIFGVIQKFSEAEELQINLAYHLVSFIYKKPHDDSSLPLSKLLIYLELTDSYQSALKEISLMCRDIKEQPHLWNAKIRMFITKFHAKVTLVLNNELTIIEEDEDSMEVEDNDSSDDTS